MVTLCAESVPVLAPISTVQYSSPKCTTYYFPVMTQHVDTHQNFCHKFCLWIAIWNVSVLQVQLRKCCKHMPEVPCKFSCATSEDPLCLPHESTATTTTSYSALGSKPRSVTLVLDEYTVVYISLLSVSRYPTL